MICALCEQRTSAQGEIDVRYCEQDFDRDVEHLQVSNPESGVALTLPHLIDRAISTY